MDQSVHAASRIKWTRACMQPAEFTTRNLIKILKQQMCESHYSLLCSADLKNEWNYNHTPSFRGEEHLYFIHISSNCA